MSNNSTAPFLPVVGHEPWEKWVAGTLSIVTSAVPMVWYVPCLYIFATDKEMSVKACYKFMLHLGISDMLQLFLLGVMGGFYILAGDVNWPSYWIMFYSGAIGNGAWFACNCFAHLLAFNRFVLVVLPTYELTIFPVRLTQLYLVIGWLWAVFFFITHIIPGCGFIFNASEWAWWYKPGYENVPFCNITGQVDYYQNWTQVFMMGIWYTLLFIRLLTLPNQGENASNKKEIRVLVQSFLIFISLLILNIYWWIIMPLLEGSKWALLFIQILWNFNSGMNPIMYLIFNTQLRMKYKALLGIKKVASMGPSASQRPTGFSRSKRSSVAPSKGKVARVG